MVTINTAEALSKLLAELKKRGNLLYPMAYCDSIPPMHKISIREVMIDTNPDHQEIYHPKQVGAGKFALTAKGLRNLELAVGIDWVSQACFRKDNGMIPNYCVFTAAAKVQDLDGSFRTVTAEITLDYRDSSIAVEGLTAGDVKQRRMSIQQRAETAAKNRVRREVIGLSPVYTIQELSRPFIVLKLIKDIPRRYNDAVAASLIGVGQILCGTPTVEEVLEAPTYPERDELADNRTPKEKIIDEVNTLYLQKLGAPRPADRAPLVDLSLEQLQEILKVLNDKEDFRG